jgi:hypothetical protein
MEPMLYLLTTHAEYPPLLITAANQFDAVDLYRDHFAIGTYDDDELEVAVEVYKVPVVGTVPMVHPLDDSTVTGSVGVRHVSGGPDRFAITFETAYRLEGEPV